ncbi:MAG: short-chain fatty acyl-CoA regulator family protein, partial [Pseudomonadota bacterium]
AQIILRLAEAYEVDVRTLAPGSDASVLVSLREVAADPILKSADLSYADLADFAENFPQVADAMVRLHSAYRETRETVQIMSETAHEGIAYGAGLAHSPVEETREALQAHDNYYGELEGAAADIKAKGAVRTDLPQALTTSLVNHLKTTHNIDVQIMPYDVMKGLLRRFDQHKRRLLLSELLTPSGRTFQVAHLVGTLEAGELVRAVAQDERLTSDASRALYRVTLLNYLAGAIMLPYSRVLEAAERLRYDVDIMASRFGASFEQVAHRLTTLRRPGEKGVPFFMVRVDRAGNMSKRFGGGVFPFARTGGSCPRWQLYEAFRVPGRVMVDVASLPEGQSFITIARTVERPAAGAHSPGQEMVVGLGAELSQAGNLVYADGLDLSARGLAKTLTPIGVNCRVCPREDCNWRAVPPISGQLVIDATRRSMTPYSFVN